MVPDGKAMRQGIAMEESSSPQPAASNVIIDGQNGQAETRVAGMIQPAALLEVMEARGVSLREFLLCFDGHLGILAFIMQTE